MKQIKTSVISDRKNLNEGIRHRSMDTKTSPKSSNDDFDVESSLCLRTNPKQALHPIFKGHSTKNNQHNINADRHGTRGRRAFP